MPPLTLVYYYYSTYHSKAEYSFYPRYSVSDRVESTAPITLGLLGLFIILAEPPSLSSGLKVPAFGIPSLKLDDERAAIAPYRAQPPTLFKGSFFLGHGDTTSRCANVGAVLACAASIYLQYKLPIDCSILSVN